MKLDELQQALLVLLRRDTPVAGDPGVEGLASLIAAGNARLSPAEQIDIYREQFFLRHIGCLIDDFPALEAVLGLGAFEALCRAYLRDLPPGGFSLRDLGVHLADYVGRGPLPAGAPRAALVDLARLEWALVDAFDAAELPPLDPAALGRLGPDDLDLAVLTFDPSLVLLALDHPVHRMQPEAAAGEPFELPPPRPTWLGVHRRLDRELAWHEIPELAYRSLLPLRQGLPLSTALDQVAASLTDPVELELLTGSVGAWFTDWVQRGWIRAITPATP